MSYLWLHRPDIVGGKHSRLVTNAPVPPFSFSFCHHDNIPLNKCQVACLWALVCVQGHIFWLRQTEALRLSSEVKASLKQLLQVYQLDVR